MDCVEVQVSVFADSQNGFFRFETFKYEQYNPEMDDLLMLRNSVFTVRNVEIWAVLYSNEVDLLMLKKRVCRLRIVQKCSVPSRKGLIC